MDVPSKVRMGLGSHLVGLEKVAGRMGCLIIKPYLYREQRRDMMTKPRRRIAMIRRRDIWSHMILHAWREGKESGLRAMDLEVRCGGRAVAIRLESRAWWGMW